jgi:hypothetical protein
MSYGGRRRPVQYCIVGLTLSFIGLFFIDKLTVVVNDAAKMRLPELARNNPYFDKLDEDCDWTNWVGDIFPSSLTRNLLLDATTLSSQSSSHEVLKTFYDGDVVSTSIEFTLQNHNANGDFCSLSLLL